MLFGDECTAAVELAPPGQRGRPTELVLPRVFAVDDLGERQSSGFCRLSAARFFCAKIVDLN